MIKLCFWRCFTFLVKNCFYYYFFLFLLIFWNHCLLRDPTNAYSPHGLFPAVEHEAGSVACKEASVSHCISINLFVVKYKLYVAFKPSWLRKHYHAPADTPFILTCRQAAFISSIQTHVCLHILFWRKNSFQRGFMPYRLFSVWRISFQPLKMYWPIF